jgi:cysteine-rich repeat protein
VAPHGLGAIGSVQGDSADSTAGTTQGPIAECGNGNLEAFGDVPEECDDGNLDPDDGCSETCALDRRVFVTSIRYQAGALEGLYIPWMLMAPRSAVTRRAARARRVNPRTWRASQ